MKNIHPAFEHIWNQLCAYARGEWPSEPKVIKHDDLHWSIKLPMPGQSKHNNSDKKEEYSMSYKGAKHYMQLLEKVALKFKDKLTEEELHEVLNTGHSIYRQGVGITYTTAKEITNKVYTP